MYKDHVTEIQNHVARRGTAGIVDVGLFVLLTIQAGLSTVKGQSEKIKVDGIASATCLWGKKREGYQYLIDNQDYLHGKVIEISELEGFESVQAASDIIELFLDVPNLGMVKAAFVAQCLGFNVGCIDSHNLKRLGLDSSAVSLGAKLKPKTKRKKIEAYVAMTQEKGSEFWWDTWCNHVAGNIANRKLTDGEMVSEYHVECIEYNATIKHGE